MATTNVESPVELWKDVPGYEGYYQVSDQGRVKSLARTFRSGKNGKNIQHYPVRILTIRTYAKTGYHYVGLCINGRPVKCKIHRLVALAFIPNPFNKPQVDHINTIRTDNRPCNLQWATAGENMSNPISKDNHRVSKLGDLNPSKSKRKKIEQVDPNSGEVIKTWLGVNEMCAKMGYHSSGIVRCCNGKLATSHGFIWRYVA